MPPAVKYSKETILRTALSLIRDKGSDCLTARNLSQYLGSSPRPIFTAFKNMDDLAEQVRIAGLNYFHGYMKDLENHTPRIKYYCSRLVHFAILEPNIYKYIFFSSSAISNTDMRGIYSDLSSYFILAADELASLFSLSKEDSYMVANQVSLTAHALCTLAIENLSSITDEQLNICLGRSLASALMLTKSGIKDECGSAASPGGLSDADKYLVKYINNL